MAYTQKKSRVWIGTAHVTPVEGNEDLGDGLGANVNVLHWATSKQNFMHKVKNELLENGFHLVEFRDITVFDFSIADEYGDQLGGKARLVLKTQSLHWGTFYTYMEE